MLQIVRLCALCLTFSAAVLSLGGCPTPNPIAAPVGDSDRVAAPVFSPPRCSFLDSMELIITCPTPGAAIRYTLDGSIPSDLVGTVYTGKITLTQTTTVRAVAYAEDLAASGVVSATFTRAQREPGTVSISDHTVAGTLITGQPCMLTVSCTVNSLNRAVESVSADLSEVGGLAAQPLARSGAKWGWSGMVLPAKSGPSSVRFAVNDPSQTLADAETTVEVAQPNVPPSIADPVASGTLTQGDPCTISLSCSASDPDGAVRFVMADLSPIGGSPVQPLSGSGGQWSWSGAVTPPQVGYAQILFTVVDDRGATGTVSTAVVIAPAVGRPTISAPSVTGNLQAGEPGTITVSCTVTDAEGTVESVAVDLSQLGGPVLQPLAATGEQWSWTGTVTPATNGPRTVTFAATNDQNRTGNSVVTVYVAGSQSGSIAGTWHGTMDYVFFFINPDTGQLVDTWEMSKASTISFSDGYQPDTFLVFWGDPSLLEIPAANFVNPGDTGVFDLMAIGDPPAHMVTVTATVESVTRSATAYSIDLSLQIDIHDGHSPILCAYHWEASLNANDQIEWTESSEFLFSGLHMTDATGTGLLSRQ